MFLMAPKVHQNVINEDYYKLVSAIMEYCIYQIHKHYRDIN